MTDLDDARRILDKYGMVAVSKAAAELLPDLIEEAVDRRSQQAHTSTVTSRIMDRLRTHGIPGVRAELVREGLVVPRRRIRAAIEALGLDASLVAGLVIDRQQVTIVYRDHDVLKLIQEEAS